MCQGSILQGTTREIFHSTPARRSLALELLKQEDSGVETLASSRQALAALATGDVGGAHWRLPVKKTSKT